MFEFYVTILMLAIALAMDAFAVSISLGMANIVKGLKDKLKVALTFGGFQAGMFFIGTLFLYIFPKRYIELNHYIAAILLGILGIRMIREGLSEKAEMCPHGKCLGLDCKKTKCDRTGQYRFLTTKLLLTYGIATSIDALAAGIAYSLSYDRIILAVTYVCAITLLFSYFGVKFGLKLKHMIGDKADIIGGIILIILAIKSLV
ncbi:manganese efflux pump MntP [Haloplasma contractile]|uniref:Putative manganese efflux pump MntP n=1 Tax=Haloplasma contractile SSD-17B TaxID=1033810 RepID=U2E6V6_9MOLU|nr:manganese efflux pump [Haloplasma contractile]ERJ10948.1 Putative manganese efflux pump MntP protein [Haloplasma contractile SSD-17B]